MNRLYVAESDFSGDGSDAPTTGLRHLPRSRSPPWLKAVSGELIRSQRLLPAGELAREILGPELVPPCPKTANRWVQGRGQADLAAQPGTGRHPRRESTQPPEVHALVHLS